MGSDRRLGVEAARIVGLMRETGAPLVVSAKIERRPETWRDYRGVVRHTAYPLFSEEPGRFFWRVTHLRGVRSLMSRWLLEPFRPGWLVRARFRLREVR